MMTAFGNWAPVLAVGAALLVAGPAPPPASAATADGQPTQLEKVQRFYAEHPGLRRYRENIQQLLTNLQTSNAANSALQQQELRAAQQRDLRQTQRAQDLANQAQAAAAAAALQRQACLANCQSGNFCNGLPAFDPRGTCSTAGALCRAQCR